MKYKSSEMLLGRKSVWFQITMRCIEKQAGLFNNGGWEDGAPRDRGTHLGCIYNDCDPICFNVIAWLDYAEVITYLENEAEYQEIKRVDLDICFGLIILLFK